MNHASPSTTTGLVPESMLDWRLFADHLRAENVAGLDRSALARSATLQRVVDLAALLAGSEFAQISLISDVQFVPAAHGCAAAPFMGTPKDDSLCSVTMASGESLIIGDTSTHPWVSHLAPVVSGAVGSYIGIPLRNTAGQLLGALCVYDEHVSAWPDHLAAALADLVTFAEKEIEQIGTINDQSLSLEELTNMIQRIVAPAPDATPLGIQIIGRYLSSNVGGDWYEWTPLESQIAITVGDVAGHGLPAVATMASLKAHVRAYVLEGHSPGETLHRVSRAFARSGEMATVLDARFRPADRMLTYASSGHAPPLIIRDGQGFFADLEPGPPVGFGSIQPRTHSLLLEVGDIVVICTDGLYEQRRTSITESLEALRSRTVAIAQEAADLEQFADTLMHIPLSDTSDDASLVILRA